MAKRDIKDADERVRGIVAARTRGLQGARAWLASAEAAFRFGYDSPAPATPMLDEIERLRSIGDKPGVIHFRSANRDELAAESRAKARWEAWRRWAAEPNPIEIAEAQRNERERAAREKAIAARTQAILASEQMKREATARARAEKELDQ